jgi:hypothetical protein
LSIDQDAWDAVLGNSLETSANMNSSYRLSPRATTTSTTAASSSSVPTQSNTNIGTRFSLSKNLGSPHHGGGGGGLGGPSTLLIPGFGNTSLNQHHQSIDFGFDGTLSSTLGNSLNNGGSLGGGGVGGLDSSSGVVRNLRSSATSSVLKSKKSSTTPSSSSSSSSNINNNNNNINNKDIVTKKELEGDGNADSLESRLSGMSIEEEEWRKLDGTGMREPGKFNSNNNNNGGGLNNAAFRLSPRDDWVFRASSQQAAAEGAAAAVLNGTLGNSLNNNNNSLYGTHDMLNDSGGGVSSHVDFENGESIYNWPAGISHKYVPSPTGSIDEEDWDLLCGMGTTPKSLSSSYQHPGTRSSVQPQDVYSLRASSSGTNQFNGGVGMPSSSSSRSPTSSSSSSLAVPRRTRAVRRVSPPRTAVTGGGGESSSSNGGMTPRARALMAVNEDFRAGRIGKDEKQRIKDQILHGHKRVTL